MLVAGFSLYSAAWIGLTLSKYYSLNSTVFDLGTLAQSTWGIFHQQYTVTSLLGLFAYDGLSFLLAPLSSTGNYPTLLILQTLVIAAAVFPVYGLALRFLKSEKVALAIGASYLLYFPLAGPNWFDVHSEAFFPTFFLMGVYFFTNGQLKTSLIGFVLSAIVKFPFCIFAGLFAGITLLEQFNAHRKGKPTTRTRVLFSTALGIFVGIQFLSFFFFFSTPLATIVTKPTTLYNGVNFSASISSRILTLVLFFSPLLYIPLLSKRWVLFALPFIYLVCTSNYWGYVYPKLFLLQYPAALFPFLFLGLIDGLVLLQKLRHTILPLALLVLIAIAGMALVFQPYGPFNSNSLVDYKLASNITVNPSLFQQYMHMVSLIPRDDSYVLFQNNMPQLLPRPLTYCPTSPYPSLVSPMISSLVTYNYTFQCPDSSWVSVMPNYVIADPYSVWYNDKGAAPYNQSMYDFAHELYSSGSYGLLAEASGMILLKRGYSGEPAYFVPLASDYAASELATQVAILDSKGLTVSDLPSQGIYQTLWYGPYTDIGPGLYNVTFWIEGTNFSSSDTLQLRVTADSGQAILASRIINASELKTGVSTPITLLAYSDNLFEHVEFTGSVQGWKGTLSLGKVNLQQVAPGLPLGTDEYYPASKFAPTPASRIGADGVLRASNVTNAAVWYGPYLTLGPGSYNATFWLSGQNAGSTDNLQLQVTADYATIYLAQENVTGSTLSGDVLSRLSIVLNLNQTYSQVELRGFAIRWTGTLELRYVTLSRN